MKTKKLLAIACVLISVFCGNAQDTRYAQAFANPLRLNPAIMGANNDLRAMLSYRNQWANIDKGYTSYSFSFLSPIYFKEYKEKLDIGLNVNSDKAGAFKATDFSLSMGYGVNLTSNNTLSLALQFGYMQKSLGMDNLTFDEQYVNGSYSSSNTISEVILNEKTGYADAGFGLLWYYNGSSADSESRIDNGGSTGGNDKISAYAGVSGYHLNKPNESFMDRTAKLPMRISYIGGIKIVGDNKIDFTPNVRVTQQKGAAEIAAGIYMDYRFNATAKMVVGAWYRSHDAIAFALGIEHKSFTLGYSYDIVTDLNSYVSGANANEISLSYKLNVAEKRNIKTKPSSLPTF